MENPNEQKKKNYFYVLWCKDNSFYAGYTTDLTRRENEHNKGIGAKYTRPISRRPLNMIYAEFFDTRSEAMKAEAAFKKLTRYQKERYLEKQGINFPLKRSTTCLVKNGVDDNANATKL